MQHQQQGAIFPRDRLRHRLYRTGRMSSKGHMDFQLAGPESFSGTSHTTVTGSHQGKAINMVDRQDIQREIPGIGLRRRKADGRARKVGLDLRPSIAGRCVKWRCHADRTTLRLAGCHALTDCYLVTFPQELIPAHDTTPERASIATLRSLGDLASRRAHK